MTLAGRRSGPEPRMLRVTARPTTPVAGPGAGERARHVEAGENVEARRGYLEDDPPRNRPVRTGPQQTAGDKIAGGTPDVRRAPVESVGEIHHSRLRFRDMEQEEHVHRSEARPVDRVEETHYRCSAVITRDVRREWICTPVAMHVTAAHALHDWVAVA